MSISDDAGNLYLLLEQDAGWVDIKGRTHWVDRMSVRYKQNCINFQRRRAGAIARMYLLGESIITMEHPVMAPRGDMARDGFESAMDEAAKERRDKPVEWLDSTPLMQKLIQQVRDGVGGADDDSSLATEEERMKIAEWLWIRRGKNWREATPADALLDSVR